MADGADIALPDTGVPVELDRIYASLRDLSEALGPNGVNKDGTLDHVLEAGANALEGQGAARQPDADRARRGGADVRRGRRAALRHRHPARRVHHHPGAERPVRPRLHPRPGRACPRSSPTSATRSRQALAVGRRRRRHREDVRPRQPRGAGHRRREADPGDEDDQLREGQHRHRAAGRADRDRQPRAWRSTTRPARSAPGSASAATSGTPTASSARVVQQAGLPRRQRGPRLRAVRAAARAGRGPAAHDPAGRTPSGAAAPAAGPAARSAA